MAGTKIPIFTWPRARKSSRCPSTAWTISSMAGRSDPSSRAMRCTENTTPAGSKGKFSNKRQRARGNGIVGHDNLLLHMQQKVALQFARRAAMFFSMQPKTEEFLNLLLWSADMLARPTFRNLTDSYESWAYRNGLMRQVATLQEQQLLERDASTATDRLYRLTVQGRLHVLGGRDPEERWARRWDGQWRLVLFDVPTGQNAQRERLRDRKSVV